MTSPNYIHQLSTLDKVKHKFLVLLDESKSYMGADYGPPDPPPQMESFNYIEILGFVDEPSLMKWIEENQNTKWGNPKQFKLLKVEELNVEMKVEFKIK